jgi:Restriction endonuclease
MTALAGLLARLDRDPVRRGRQFEHICKWFLTNDPVYKHELGRVWLWNEWPGRWGTDAGIDLVAEDRNGHLWAIQAKVYDPAYRVSERDVNKFLAESGHKVADAFEKYFNNRLPFERVGQPDSPITKAGESELTPVGDQRVGHHPGVDAFMFGSTRRPLRRQGKPCKE